MGFLDRVAQFFALEPLQQRDLARVDLPLDMQLAGIRRDSHPQPWRSATIREALGIPAVYRAVSLIASTVGSLQLEAYRNGVRMSERPRLIVRPNPVLGVTPRDFFHDTAWSMATRGEAWWWIGKRDLDGQPLSLIQINPTEVRVTANDENPLRPTITWRNRDMPNEDMVQIVLNREPGDLRGAGPLQLCAAAVSVAVEAQEWAANFYAEGGFPNIVLESDYEFKSEEEPTMLKHKWTSNPPNTPQVLGGGFKAKPIAPQGDGAQMLNARLHQNGEVALMFGVPGTMLEHGIEGGGVTYQNVETKWTDFLRSCLLPNYLYPIQAAMTDLLPRSTIAKFDVDDLERADSKTRFETHKLAIESGVYSEQEARVKEGLEPGDLETAPIPFSPPQAIPTRLPIARSLDNTEPIRCAGCGRSRMIVYGGGAMRCVGCKKEVAA
jgi:HK97 family phage portal protein